MSKKYEQLIEYIINDEEDKAKELFHDIVVETSRDIYENLIDEEDYAEEESVEDMSDAIEADEEGISEEDDEMDMDMEMPMDMGDEEGDEESEEEAEEEEIEDRVMDLEDALDELKAEFDAMMDGDKEEDDDDMEMESVEESEETVEEAEEVDESEEEVTEDEEEVVREYVEKAPQPKNDSASSKSPVAGKNDMGGKSVDPTGEESGSSTPKVAPGKSYQNTAGGKKTLAKAPAPKTGE